MPCMPYVMSVGAVALGRDRVKEAIDHYEKALLAAQMVVSAAQDDRERRRAYRALSDRMGNLAVALIRVNDLPRSFQLLEQSMELDTQHGNVAGWVQKQGALGHWYLAQGTDPKEELQRVHIKDNLTEHRQAKMAPRRKFLQRRSSLSEHLWKKRSALTGITITWSVGHTGYDVAYDS
jgi:tetratricopeptide (TPR) repeat protein